MAVVLVQESPASSLSIDYSFCCVYGFSMMSLLFYAIAGFRTLEFLLLVNLNGISTVSHQPPTKQICLLCTNKDNNDTG